MAFKKLLNLECDVTTAIGGKDRKTGKPNPKSVEGYFLGSKDVESPRGKNKLHVFQTVEGNVGVWGKTHLNQQMLSVTPGTMTRATFSSMMQTKNGEMYRYDVEVDNDEKIEVALADPSLNQHAPNETFDEEPVEEEAEEETAPAPIRKPAVAAKAADPERQARIQALLNGKRSA